MTDDDRDIAELLRRLDHQLPDVDVADVVARGTVRRRWPAAPIAAAAVLLVVATAAALPFTPVHRALMRAVAAVTDRPEPAPAPAVTRPVQGTGVALVPNDRLTVRFVAPPPDTRLRVVFATAPRASLVPEGGDAAFAVGEDAIVVSDARAPAFLLTVPPQVAELRVERDGTLLLRKHGSVVVTSAPRDAGGAYLVELSPRAP